MSNFFYIPSQDKFMRIDGSLYTHEEIENIDRQEREWKESVQDYSFYELIEMFPEAKKIAKKHLKAELKAEKAKSQWLAEWRENYTKIINNVHFTEQAFYIQHADEQLAEGMAEIDRRIKKIMFNLSHVEEKKGVSAPRSGIKEADIAQAKEVLITHIFVGTLHTHKNLATGKCPFHTEKTGSFTVYTKQNTWWCYGCAQGGTVIDFVMRKQNVEFLKAVKLLLNK